MPGPRRKWFERNRGRSSGVLTNETRAPSSGDNRQEQSGLTRTHALPVGSPGRGVRVYACDQVGHFRLIVTVVFPSDLPFTVTLTSASE